MIAARNKSHLKNSGEGALDISGVASKFQGRGGFTDAYNFAMSDLSKAISGLSKTQRDKIFQQGSSFLNLEVIYPTSVNVIQAALTPLGAITPPAKIGINITASILAQIVAVNASITTTIAQSVAVLGGPSPTYAVNAALVGTQLTSLSTAIQTGLITPQQI